jgi:hypothetical protein
MRLGERIELEGNADVHLSNSPESWSIEAYDVSPTALALIIPVDHELMEAIPDLLQPGSFLMVNHDFFGEKKCIVHRIFRHKNETTKWVLSFVHKISTKQK